MPPLEDRPTPEFLARLAAFEPEYAPACSAKEMVELLVIVTDAPPLVQSGVDGFLKGTYADRLSNSIVKLCCEATDCVHQSSS